MSEFNPASLQPGDDTVIEKYGLSYTVGELNETLGRRLKAIEDAETQGAIDRQKNPVVLKGKMPEEKHVGHASIRVRTPHPLPRESFEEPQYPDVNLDELRVLLPESDDYYADERNPFVVMMELGPEWLKLQNAQGEPLDEVDLVHMAQYRCGVNLNDGDLKNLRGLARDMITKPAYEKGVLTIWHDEHFVPKNDVPKVVYNPDGTTRIIRPGLGRVSLMAARVMAHAGSDGEYEDKRSFA